MYRYPGYLDAPLASSFIGIAVYFCQIPLTNLFFFVFLDSWFRPFPIFLNETESSPICKRCPNTRIRLWYGLTEKCLLSI